MKKYLRDDFFTKMKGEWQDGFEERYSPLLGELLKLMDKDFNEKDIEDFFTTRNRFVCEKFLRYILKNGRLGRADRERAWMLLSFLSSQDITARNYDERIEALGLKHAIKTYWEPEDPVDKRRIGIVTDAIGVERGEVIIDIGCGVGTFTYRVALKGAKAIGVDYSIESIKIAKTLSRERVSRDAWIRFIVGDATNLPFKDSSADAIVSADFIEHISDMEKEYFLDEALRVLNKNGRMIVFTPNKIRESVGGILRWLRSEEGTRLHLGLTTRFSFEKKLRKRGKRYRRRFIDVVRPYLARLPLLKEIFSLNICWIIKK